jgi:hypothetical protein
MVEILMPITGELVQTYAGYRRLALSVGRTGMRATTIAVGLVSVFFGAVTSGTRLSTELIIMGCILLFGPELMVLVGWSRTRKLTDRPWRYEIGEEGVGVHTSQTDVTVRWDGISRIRSRRHAWVFKVASSKGSLPVPRAAFSPDGQQAIDRLLALRAASHDAATV